MDYTITISLVGDAWTLIGFALIAIGIGIMFYLIGKKN